SPPRPHPARVPPPQLPRARGRARRPAHRAAAEGLGAVVRPRQQRRRGPRQEPPHQARRARSPHRDPARRRLPLAERGMKLRNRLVVAVTAVTVVALALSFVPLCLLIRAAETSDLDTALFRQ